MATTPRLLRLLSWLATLTIVVGYSAIGCSKPQDSPDRGAAPGPVKKRIVAELPPDDLPPRSLGAFQPITNEQLEQYRQAIDQHMTQGRRLSSSRNVLLDIIPLLGLRPGTVLADVGAGTGYLEIALLEENVDFGAAYAIDVDKQALGLLQHFLSKTDHPRAKNIHLVASQPEDIGMPAGSTDIVAFISAPFFRAEKQPDGSLRLDAITQRCLVSAVRALKPQGVIHVFNTSHTDRYLDEEITYPFKVAGLKTGAINDLSLGRMPVRHFVFTKSGEK
ncbi:MAG: methyltransferase [Candidatus Lernaella stagnicola]|nr:methyltransferase [Candidatus Lernaella stagnicola]